MLRDWDPRGEVVAFVMEKARVNMRELSEEAGVSYNTLRSWASGRRSPTSDGLLALADALERRSERLADLSDKVRQMVTTE